MATCDILGSIEGLARLRFNCWESVEGIDWESAEGIDWESI